jgi:aconitate hydratase
MAGPRRPQDRIALSQVGRDFTGGLSRSRDREGFGVPDRADATATVRAAGVEPARIGHGAVVIAAITSCTNTSNPSVMLTAGLLAKKAVERGLTTRSWVKTSLAPGSRVVTRYLDEAGLTGSLEKLGFHTVGYGCTTCIGNSGPLPVAVEKAVDEADLVVAAVLSGNRNFEGRIHQKVRASYLASPPLVVAYALAGRVDIDLTTEPVGTGKDGEPVMLADLWPTVDEISGLMEAARRPSVFRQTYGDIDRMNDAWNGIRSSGGAMYAWDDASTYINEPPFFTTMTLQTSPIAAIDGARVLVMVGDSITTDHISPAGAIAADGPAGRFLSGRGIARRDFNTYGSRRGDDRVMTRGTFANIRLRNLLAPGTEGGFTIGLPGGEVTTIYEASRGYIDAGIPTVVLAGKDYGMGSSRDWAAKGTLLLGVRAVIAESFERIHRSNLVGMGVLPLEFREGESRQSLGLTGRETYSIPLDDDLEPGARIEVVARADDGTESSFSVICRLDSLVDVEYYRNGGILHAVLRDMISG